MADLIASMKQELCWKNEKTPNIDWIDVILTKCRVFSRYLSAGLLGRMWVMTRGRFFETSEHVPPRMVNPNPAESPHSFTNKMSLVRDRTRRPLLIVDPIHQRKLHERCYYKLGLVWLVIITNSVHCIKVSAAFQYLFDSNDWWSDP